MISMLCTIIIAIVTSGPSGLWVIVFTGIFHLLCVQGIPVVSHLPLNNRIQKLDVDKMTSTMLVIERSKLEEKWTYFNNIRKGIAFSVSFILILIISVG